MIFLEIFAMMTHVGFCAMGPGRLSKFLRLLWREILCLGAIPWLLSTEMFFQSERAYASAIGSIVNWLSMFFVIMTFIPLFVSWFDQRLERFYELICLFQHTFDALLFLMYGGMSCTFWLLTFLFLPETRRKIPEHVQVLVGKGTIYKSKHQQ